jgi:hypothetical protein
MGQKRPLMFLGVAIGIALVNRYRVSHDGSGVSMVAGTTGHRNGSC